MSDGYRNERIRRHFASVAASQTDSELWPAEPGYGLRVLAAYAMATAATALTFNTKASGASGIAISAPFTSANGTPTVAWQPNDHGWCETRPGEALTVTTGAGQTHQIQFTIVLVPGVSGFWDQASQQLLLENSQPLLMEDG